MTASQVGQYGYCAHAWWLAVVEKQAPADLAALDAGVEAHERHSWAVSLARGAHRLAFLLLGLATVALIAWAVSALVR